MSRLDHRFQRLAGVPSRTFPGDALGARATLGARYMMESLSLFKKIRERRENFLLTRVNVWGRANRSEPCDRRHTAFILLPRGPALHDVSGRIASKARL
jgi:hypothetical protein